MTITYKDIKKFNAQELQDLFLSGRFDQRYGRWNYDRLYSLFTGGP